MFTIEHEKTTRQELSHKLFLSPGTVSALCNRLIFFGYAKEFKTGNKARGRKTRIFCMNTDTHYIALLDIHKTRVAKFYVLKLDATIHRQSDFSIGNTFEEFVQNFFTLYQSKNLSGLRKMILGIVVAVSATMHKATNRTVSALHPIFEEVPVQKEIANICRMPVIVENESVICTAANVVRHLKHQGNGGCSIYVFIEEGLGIGIVANNRLIKGDNGLGSEISNIICPYSKHMETAEKILSSTSTKRLKTKAKTLGYVLSLLVNLFDCNTFHIGGYLSHRLDDLLADIHEVLDTFVLHNDLRAIQLVPDTDYEKTLRHGAAALVIPEIIKTIKSKSK